MKARIEKDGRQIKVYLSGTIDVPGAAQLATALEQVLASGCKEVTLDFAGVDHIGSSGIGNLSQFHQSLASKGGTAAITSCNPQITTLFKAVKLDLLFRF